MIFRKDTGSIWTSISDLMTGLMVIFLFVCMGFLYQLNGAINSGKLVQDEINAALHNEFSEDELANWGVSMNEENLRVTFVAPAVFFDLGSTAVKPKFQEILAEFFPRYIKVIDQFSDHILEVRIEGNASREIFDDINSDAAYFYNMKLSQERAFNVLQYVFTLEEMTGKRQWMIDKLRATGASFSKANLERADASRCVEISIHRNFEKEMKNLERH